MEHVTRLPLANLRALDVLELTFGKAQMICTVVRAGEHPWLVCQLHTDTDSNIMPPAGRGQRFDIQLAGTILFQEMLKRPGELPDMFASALLVVGERPLMVVMQDDLSTVETHCKWVLRAFVVRRDGEVLCTSEETTVRLQSPSHPLEGSTA